MKIDFPSILASGEGEERPQKAHFPPAEATKGGEGVNSPYEPQTPAETNTGDTEGIQSLRRQAEANQRATQRAFEICREYQQNILASSQLQAEILQGVKAGVDAYTLLLKACKAVSLMTSNKVFYSQIEADIRAVHGEGLLYPAPLQMERTQTQERLTMLYNAMKRDTTDADSKKRIGRAIAEHEAKIASLETLMRADTMPTDAPQ